MLYDQLIASIKINDIFPNLVKEFLYIRIEYNIYLPEFIDDVYNIIYIYELFYKLFKEDKCINYQILLNLQYNMNNYLKVIDKLREKLIKGIIEKNEMENFNQKYKVNIMRLPLIEDDYNIDIISLDLKKEILEKEEILNKNNIIEKK